MNKLCLSLIIFSLFSLTLLSQTPEQNYQKYLNYRERFRQEFIHVSPNDEQGTNVPSTCMSDNILYWGDGNGQLPYYIGMLATEYYLLKDKGLDYTQTKNELLYALKAVERLDYYAESYFKKNGIAGTPTLNGFMIRDDIPISFTNDLQNQHPAFADIDVNSCFSEVNRNNEMSKDNVWHYLIGLALVKELVDDIEIKGKARNIAYRMIKQMHNTSWTWGPDPDRPWKMVKIYFTHWKIINPVTGDLVQEGGNVDEVLWAELDLSGLRYGFAEAGNWIAGPPFESLHYGSDNDKYRGNFIESLLFMPGFYDSYSYRALATVGNTGLSSENISLYDFLKERRSTDVTHPYEHFPLIQIILHGVNGSFSFFDNNEIAYYENLLNKAPLEGPYNNGEGDCVKEWSATNRLVWPENSGALTPSYKGEYNGLDYMLLYNLFNIVYKDPCFFLRNEDSDDFEVSGPSSVCISNNATFTLNNYPTSANINWIKSSNLTYISGQGTSTYKINRNSSGTGWVQAEISGAGCNGVSVRHYFTDGRPIISDSQIRGGYDNVTYNSTDIFNISTASGASSYLWSIVPYSMSCSSSKLPYFVGSNTGTSVTVKHGTCSGKYILKCKATNGCGSVYYQDKVINVYNSSGGTGDPDPCATVMTIYPNPGKKTDYTTLQIQYPDDPCDDNTEAYSQAENEIKLHDLSGNLVHQEAFSSDTYTFKNANFKNGIYVVTIRDKKGKIHQKRLQIK